MGYDEAIAFGAMALFGEKYGDEVRVLKMGDFSTELCGGTHVGRTGDIGLFKIVSEAGVASGVRRIEAVTGAGALAHVADEERRLGELAQLLSGSGDEVVEKLRQLFERQKKLERELESLRAKAAGSATADLASSAQEVGGIKVVAARLEGLDAKSLRDSVDQLKQQLGDCVILLAGAAEAALRWWPACTARRWAASRPAMWWRMLPRRSTARAAAGRTWRRAAAAIFPCCRALLSGLPALGRRTPAG